MPESPIAYEHVEVLRTDGLGMWCRIDGREVHVGSGVKKSGTTIRAVGDHGRLVVPRWFAVQERLPLPADSK
jgi:hypothetical protein